MCFIQTVSGLSIIWNDCRHWKALNYLHICTPICIFIISTTASITAEENKEWTCDTQKWGEKQGKALITSDVKSASELQRSRRLQRLTAGCKLTLKGVLRTEQSIKEEPGAPTRTWLFHSELLDRSAKQTTGRNKRRWERGETSLCKDSLCRKKTGGAKWKSRSGTADNMVEKFLLLKIGVVLLRLGAKTGLSGSLTVLFGPLCYLDLEPLRPGTARGHCWEGSAWALGSLIFKHVRSLNRLNQISFIINAAIDLFKLWSFSKFRPEMWCCITGPSSVSFYAIMLQMSNPSIHLKFQSIWIIFLQTALTHLSIVQASFIFSEWCLLQHFQIQTSSRQNETTKGAGLHTRRHSQLQGLIRAAPSLAFKEWDRVSTSEIRSAVLLSAGGTWEERGGELIQDLMEKSSVAQGDQSSVAFWRYSRCALAFKKQLPLREL